MSNQKKVVILGPITKAIKAIKRKREREKVTKNNFKIRHIICALYYMLYIIYIIYMLIVSVLR